MIGSMFKLIDCRWSISQVVTLNANVSIDIVEYLGSICFVFQISINYPDISIAMVMKTCVLSDAISIMQSADSAKFNLYNSEVNINLTTHLTIFREHLIQKSPWPPCSY